MTIHLGSIEVTFLLDDTQTNDTSTMFDTIAPADAPAPIAHSHDAFEEVVYGLAGALTFTVGGEEHVLTPGDALYIGRGVVHVWDNRVPETGRFLTVATPGVFRPAYFEEMAAVLDTAAGGPPDISALMAVMHRHGLTPAPVSSAASS
jgi:mannose-6-phosphate isomerase-like protein (cupin superfamily)